ncbi:MAG: LysR family transcriptional regulator [Phormidesmis sp.]|mgnify:CR=1 FL=1
MDKVDSIKSFVRVVEMGSFSAVAKELGTTQPTISKQIAALEKYLDAQLLTRSTRKLTLTEAGDRFYTQAQNVLEALAQAEASVGRRQQPSGILRVNCPVSFGQLQVVPRLKVFLDRYPDIQLKLSMNDRFVDLVETGVDLAIRIGTVQASDLKVQQIGLTRRVAIASTQYLEQHPAPKTPADLASHNCILYQPSGSEWHFVDKTKKGPAKKDIRVSVSGNFQVDNSVAIRDAVLCGLGIGLMPVWLFGDLMQSSDLCVLLQNYQPQPLPIQIVYRRGRFIAAKTKCFIDYLSHEFELDPWVSNYGV